MVSPAKHVKGVSIDRDPGCDVHVVSVARHALQRGGQTSQEGLKDISGLSARPLFGASSNPAC